MTVNQITQQKATIEKYHKVASRIIVEFSNSTGREWQLHPLRLVEWMGERRPRWATATWRVYRAAMTHVMRTEFPSLVEETISILNHASATVAAKPHRPHRVKKLSPEHLAQIVDLATSSRSSNLSLAVLMLRGTEIVGLRPHEWFGAKREGHAVIVNNSKHTNGRAFGPVRHLKLDFTSDGENTIVDYMIDYANKYETSEAWLHRVQIVRVALGRATSSLGIPGLHLYSARHQFSANAKLAGLAQIEIAALMGHASNETAASHYGRRSAGRIGGLKVRPDEADVAIVAELNAGRAPDGYQPPGQISLPLAKTPPEAPR
jgi:integrase